MPSTGQSRSARPARGSSPPRRARRPPRAAARRYCAGFASPSGWSIRSPSTRPVAHQLERLRADHLEHLGILDPNARELADVEEPPVLSPVRQSRSKNFARISGSRQNGFSSSLAAMWFGTTSRMTPEAPASHNARSSSSPPSAVGHARRIDDVVPVRRSLPRLHRPARGRGARRRARAGRARAAARRRSRAPARAAAGTSLESPPTTPRRSSTIARSSTITSARAAKLRSPSSACGSAVDSSSFQRAPNRRGGRRNVTGSCPELKSSRNDSSVIVVALPRPRGDLLAVQEQPDRAQVAVRPVAPRHLPPVRPEPPAVRQPRPERRVPGQELRPPEHGVRRAEVDQLPRELEQPFLPVAELPVEPRDLVVLAVRVVVAVLRPRPARRRRAASARPARGTA